MVSNKKRLLAGVIAVVSLISTFTIGAVAASNSETISAILSFGTEIKYNGQVQEFKDATGKTVYPIMYEGTTYLPVRAICGLAGIAVDWDAETGTVILGEKDKVYVDDTLWKSDYSIWIESKATTETSELVLNGEAYNYGIVAKCTASTSNGWEIGHINTEKKYSKLHLKAVCKDSKEAMVRVRKDSEDGTVFKEINLSNGIVQDIEIDIKGSEKVYITLGTDDENIDSTVIISDLYLK